MSVTDMLRLRWRRFRVLFQHGFKVLTDQVDTSPVKVSEEFDWNAALDTAIGRTPPSRVNRMSVEDYMKTRR